MSFRNGPGAIRTRDLLLRRQALYPTELRTRDGGEKSPPRWVSATPPRIPRNPGRVQLNADYLRSGKFPPQPEPSRVPHQLAIHLRRRCHAQPVEHGRKEI